jgi:transposase InsO family protein
VLKELTKVEQRYDAVLGVIRDGFSITEVARKFGVSRQTLHAWMRRYLEDGIQGLTERSHRPTTSPAQIAPALEERICELRRRHPAWGQVRICHELEKAGLVAPSLSSIYRCLVRHHLIEPKASRKKLVHYKRWERGTPMELWQLDVVGGFLLVDGTECKLLTGIDDHSRFCVSAGVMERATAKAVCAWFATALERHGVPDEVLTDNGRVFTNRFSLSPNEVLFDRICRQNGIVHRLTAPGHPTTTGKVERFHRTLREEFLGTEGLLFDDAVTLQRELDCFVDDYNSRRPHRSLGMQTPSSRFSARRASPIPERVADLQALREDRTGDDWVARRVSANGTISVSNQVISVGKRHAGALVDVRVLEKLFEVWEGAELRKTVLRESRGEVRKKRAEGSNR